MRVSHTTAMPLERAVLDEWNSTLANLRHVFGDLGELTCDEAIDLIRKPQPAEDRDRTLITLLALERAGDVIAGKVLVKSFLALAFRLARTCGSTRYLWQNSPTDATATTIGALWEVIHTYPMHRTSSVAGNIRLECIKLLDRELANPSDEVTVDDETWSGLVNSQVEPWGDDTFLDLVTIFTWAIDNGTLTRDEVQLLARIELADDPGAEREASALEHGISRETLNRRVHRIRTKLMFAVSGDVHERVAYAPRRS